MSGSAWSLTGGPGGGSRGGSLGSMPVVNGLFSGLDVRAGPAPSVAVETTANGSKRTVRQALLWALGAICALAALLLVTAGGGLRRPRLRLLAPHPADAVVAVVLLCWWVLGPAFFDDGWVVAGQQNYGGGGGFSSYFTSFGVTSSLQYWLEWIEHPLFAGTSALVLLRLPALACLGATWILCRWILSRTGSGAAELWALAAAFLVGALAWGMTLRPEPVVALLVTGVLACTVRFLERESTAPLAVAAVLAALALSAHPAGLVSLAPLLVAAPRLVGWARTHLAAAATVAAAGVALLGVLAVLGSDLHQLHANATSLRAYGDESAGWRDELNRYSLLARPLYGAPLRRLWVALALLAVLAYLLRRRREPRGSLLDLPAAALGVSLLALIATPSKVPWHFGTLLGVAAVAGASETARLRGDAGRAPRLHARPFVAVGAAMLVAAWAWFPRNPWSDLDLRTLSWTLGIERRLTFAKLAGVAPLVVLAGLTAIELARRRRIGAAPWRAAAWTLPIVAFPLVAFTIGVLAADATKTSTWTLTRQNLDTLTGDNSCGLAHDALVAVPSSMRALRPLGAASPSGPRLPPPPVAGLPRFALRGPSPWYAVPQQARAVGFFVGGTAGPTEALRLEWGRASGGRVESLGRATVSTDFGADARQSLVPWRFFARSDLPSAPRGANALRLVARSDAVPPASVAVTAPVSYRNEPLSSALAASGSPSLVLPNLVTYVPCARLPQLHGGVADVPRRIVAFRTSIWPLATGTSPFDGVFDLYAVRRLLLTDTTNPPGDVAVYDVDTHIAGAAVLAPVAS